MGLLKVTARSEPTRGPSRKREGSSYPSIPRTLSTNLITEIGLET